eukprot:1159946-Pelagomonas_calceolata.AAC.3
MLFSLDYHVNPSSGHTIHYLALKFSQCPFSSQSKSSCPQCMSAPSLDSGWSVRGNAIPVTSALPPLHRVHAGEPNSLKALYRRGQARLGLSQWVAAAQDLERAAQLSASDPEQQRTILARLKAGALWTVAGDQNLQQQQQRTIQVRPRTGALWAVAQDKVKVDAACTSAAAVGRPS